MNKKILIVEDDPGIQLSLKDEFESEGYDVLAANDGEKGLKLIKEQKPDLIILDIMLPGLDGYEVCKSLRKEGNNTPVIMLTVKDKEIDKVLGLEFGADDYVTKPFSLRELAARIKANLRRTIETKGAPALKEKTLVCGDLTIDPSKREIYKKKRKIYLTSTEFNLLWILASQPGIVFSRDKLLDEVRNRELELFDRSVDAHISHLRKKIEDSPKKPRYIVTVWGTGYKFQEK